MRKLLRAGSKGLGIDLGTVNTLISDHNSRILLNEPSVVAFNHRTNRIEAVGRRARAMLGRTPSFMEVIMPLRDGVINHFDLTREMLKEYLKKVQPRLGWLGTKLVICVPTETTQIERRAVRETGLSLKSAEVYVVEEPMAAACGVGYPVSEAKGSMIVDIGGGTTEIAVISLSGIVCSGSIRVAGTHMDDAIIQFIRRRYNLLIGEDTAERIKLEIGYADLLTVGTQTAEVKGRDLVTQLPKTLTVTSRDVTEAITEQVGGIIASVKKTLERTPPELSADISSCGIIMTGGGSLLGGLAGLVQKETGIPVKVADDAPLSVARGASRLLNDPDLLARVHVGNL